jgi:predicted DNA-binding transcriptional regulator YafY
MRADRVISLLMLLQTRGQMTAQKLASELEVSVRTIYRDIDALSAAGVPVYAERGPGGGCALVDSYRTTLTGLTKDEVRALFMLSIPAPLDDLGLSQELRGALLKLAAALPATHRQDEAHTRQRIYLDWVDWSPQKEPVPYLQVVRRAVWQDRKLRLAYRLQFGSPVERQVVVDPYGLVAKGGTWYLVCAGNGHTQVHPVSRLLDARILDQSFERSPDFDLVTFWKDWCVQSENIRPQYPVTVRVAPDLVPLLPYYFGDQIRATIAQAGPPDADGWTHLVLPFETLEEARTQILGLGRAVEVLEPLALRKSVVDFATQITDLYGQAMERGE